MCVSSMARRYITGRVRQDPAVQAHFLDVLMGHYEQRLIALDSGSPLACVPRKGMQQTAEAEEEEDEEDDGSLSSLDPQEPYDLVEHKDPVDCMACFPIM